MTNALIVAIILLQLVDMWRSRKRHNRIMKTLDNLEADVTRLESAAGSANLLLGRLTQAIKDLKDSQTDPATAARIDALASRVETDADALSAAVVANTPAEGEPATSEGDPASGE